MPINLKALGLTMMVVFAVSAVVASSASAQTLEFETETSPAFLTGTSTDDVITLGTSQITCDHIEYSGTVSSPTTKLSLTPKYTGCTAFGIANTHVTATGCTFDLSLDNSHDSSEPITEGQSTIEINCGNPATGQIGITPTIFGGSVCTVGITTQSIKKFLLKTVKMVKSKLALLWKAITWGPIIYEVFKSGFGCPGVGEHENGTYHTSETLIPAYADANHTEEVDVMLVTK